MTCSWLGVPSSCSPPITDSQASTGVPGRPRPPCAASSPRPGPSRRRAFARDRAKDFAESALLTRGRRGHRDRGVGRLVHAGGRAERRSGARSGRRRAPAVPGRCARSGCGVLPSASLDTDLTTSFSWAPRCSDDAVVGRLRLGVPDQAGVLGGREVGGQAAGAQGGEVGGCGRRGRRNRLDSEGQEGGGGEQGCSDRGPLAGVGSHSFSYCCGRWDRPVTDRADGCAVRDELSGAGP